VTRGGVRLSGGRLLEPARQLVIVKAGRVERLDGLPRSPMDQLPPRQENPAGDDLANTVMCEIEPLSQAMQDASPDQLLDAGCRLLVLEPRRSLQERKLEFTPDHRGHRGERLSSLRQPLQASPDDFARAGGARDSGAH